MATQRFMLIIIMLIIMI